MAYYLILSRGTYGRYKASTSNVVRLLTAMSKQALVSVLAWPFSVAEQLLPRHITWGAPLTPKHPYTQLVETGSQLHWLPSLGNPW